MRAGFRLASLGILLCAWSIVAWGQAPVPGWPVASAAAKPWCYWFWPGNAVDTANLTRELESLAAAGMGGAHIFPVYGAVGDEAHYVYYFSPQYLALLNHAASEAKRLGMGLDMNTGTGWPFGGPTVSSADSDTRVVLNTANTIPRLDAAPTGFQVKRPAPGGAGRVLDAFSTAALTRYLQPFSTAFGSLPAGVVRAEFHDSFEYQGNWSSALPAAFLRMHGYDLQTTNAATAFMGQDPRFDRAQLGRMKSDYRETLASLHLAYITTWAHWAHALGQITRNEAHGAPSNLLDCYAAADIPETEVFGPALAYPMINRFASSAAHVAGRQLVGCESCTWLRNHWHETLGQAKAEMDELFVNGINHVFYIGTCYSRAGLAWPGWYFYASTQFNDRNSLWRDLPELSHYIERSQSVLQAGSPDNDILLYWPIYDLWQNPDGLNLNLTVDTVTWLKGTQCGNLADALLQRGYSFDFVSDAQLVRAQCAANDVITSGGAYLAVVVPRCDRMPEPTLRRLIDLAAQGATVIFQALPADVPGWGHLAERQSAFRAQLGRMVFFGTPQGFSQANVGDGRVLLGDPKAILSILGMTREPIADLGVRFIRRRSGYGHDYFFANLNGPNLNGLVNLGVAAQGATLLDPMTGRAGTAEMIPGPAGQAKVRLQLNAGEALILRTVEHGAAAGAPWTYLDAAGTPVPLSGTWTVSFIGGGPVLPTPAQLTSLQSWTTFGGSEVQRFAGTARYHLDFAKPAGPADAWVLDLGVVRESARVAVNGVQVAPAFSSPFRVRLEQLIRPGMNSLDIEVTNLTANRIRDLDIRGVQWKIMGDINIVNENYQTFNAATWPIELSGLLGPVTLTPMYASPKPRNALSIPWGDWGMVEKEADRR